MDEKINRAHSPSSFDIVPSTYIKPQHRVPHDPDVTFEEYHYYAQRTRQGEKHLDAPRLNWREVLLRKKNAYHAGNEDPSEQFSEEKLAKRNRLEITDEEWTNASRAFRTASWGACT